MSIATVAIAALYAICSCATRGVSAGRLFYTAGVVEFKPVVDGMNATEVLADHLSGYLDILESAEAADTDIVVFPEGTLNNELHATVVPGDKDDIIPCVANEGRKFADFFVQLSCAARRLSKYLVINLTEKEDCPSEAEDTRPCALNNLNIFNTNVVFDREGRVISRYRKVHVYVENKNTTFKPEFGLFNTDFGVRFGHFICFDILFYTPAQELVDRFGVSDFIFTSFFYSELPFLTAVQLQHGWAWGNNVNLLAAGASYPEKGATGSGIYAGAFGDLVSAMAVEQGIRQLYKARVPIGGPQFVPEAGAGSIKPSRSLANLRLLKDPQIENYNSVLVDVWQAGSHFQTHLCHGDVCCSFQVSARLANDSQAPGFRYRVGAFDGRRTYEKEEWSDIRVCALYACANDDQRSCGEALTTGNVILQSVDIQANFPQENKATILPSLLDDRLYPLARSAVQWSKRQRNQRYEVNLKLRREHTNVLTFAIYGQYYGRSSAVRVNAGTTCVVVLLLLIK